MDECDALPISDSKSAQLEELFDFLKNNTGYLIAVTILSNGKLKHQLITSDFPEIDVIKSIASYEKLAVERLKEL